MSIGGNAPCIILSAPGMPDLILEIQIFQESTAFFYMRSSLKTISHPIYNIPADEISSFYLSGLDGKFKLTTDEFAGGNSDIDEKDLADWLINTCGEIIYKFAINNKISERLGFDAPNTRDYFKEGLKPTVPEARSTLQLIRKRVAVHMITQVAKNFYDDIPEDELLIHWHNQCVQEVHNS